MRRSSFVPVVGLAVVLAACSGAEAAPTSAPASVPVASQVRSTPEPPREPTPQPTAKPTPEPTPAPTPEPTPEQPTLFKAGETVVVTQDGDDYLEITVSKVGQKKSYGSGYFVDRPEKGNIFIQAFVTYQALADGATYNQFDWQVFCDDTAVETWTIVTEGPTPELSSGTLPKGRKAQGWVVYEVPAKGRCVLSYGANSFIGEGAVFEVLLRSK